jgi:hypothetical protein
MNNNVPGDDGSRTSPKESRDSHEPAHDSQAPWARRMASSNRGVKLKSK